MHILHLLWQVAANSTDVEKFRLAGPLQKFQV